MINLVEAPDSSLLANLLADDICAQIMASIDLRGRAILALSGGSTPKPLFQALCQRDIDWPSVIITLVDERWVPASHPLSNAGLLQSHLLSALPSTRFVPLYAAAKSVNDSLPAVLNDYCAITASSTEQPAAFDVAVLGMGGDGHTASFFPDAPNINALLDPHPTAPLLSCESPSTQVPRVTWSLPMLLNSRFLALHFTGADKLAVYQQALNKGAASELPIRAVIDQNRTPLNVFYSE